MVHHSKALRFLKINRLLMTPHHQQLEDQVLQAIKCGWLSAGDPLPSERGLSEALGISRMTVRHALTDLEAQNRLTSQVGKGWYVSNSKIQQTLTQLTGFSADMQALGHHVRSQVLKLAKNNTPDNLVEKLSIAVAEPFYCLERLRLVAEEPIGLEHSHIAERVCPELERFDFTQQSLYRVMRDEYELALAWAMQEIEASFPNKHEAALLGIQLNEPVFRSRRIVYSQENMVLEYGEAVYRGDRYRYRVRLGDGAHVGGIL
jgi:GntR family transcriptional regulator